MQSITTHFRLSANHADKQMMQHFWQNSGNVQISDVKTDNILTF